MLSEEIRFPVPRPDRAFAGQLREGDPGGVAETYNAPSLRRVERDDVRLVWMNRVSNAPTTETTNIINVMPVNCATC